jgi:hypothetical protein
MKDLTMNEIQMVSGARIRPSDWLWPASVGTFTGVMASALTAFSQNPISFSVSIPLGFAIGVGFGAAYEILREYDL